MDDDLQQPDLEGRITAKLELMATAIKRHHRWQRHRMAGQEIEIRRLRKCMLQIQDDTSGIIGLLRDAPHFIRFVTTIRRALTWVARNIILPIALILGALWVIFSGELPAWVQKLKSLF